MDKKSAFPSVITILGIVGFVALIVGQALLTNTRFETIQYSDFRKLLAANQVDDLQIGQTHVTGNVRSPAAIAMLSASEAQTLKGNGPPYRFSTYRPSGDRLPDELVGTDIHYSGTAEGSWFDSLLSWILPVFAFIVFWNFIGKRPGGLQNYTGVGKSRATLYVQRESDTTFDDIAGIDEAKSELKQIVEFLCNPERYRRLGAKIPKGVLIVGGPGTGKTLLAKAVAGEANVPFLSISGSAFVEMFVGVGAARVRDLFEQAKEKAPCIVFIDELDAIGKVRGNGAVPGNDEREQTLNQLLVEMDGFEPNSGVIILAATNRPETLDPALLRPGRFDRHIAIDRPDLIGRRQILEVHVKRVTLSKNVDLSELAARTPGFAGADLANIVNEATLHAAELNKAAVEMTDFDEAIDRAMTGMERKSRVMNEQEKITIAYHEAGHALVAQSRAHCDPVKKVSIIPRGIAALGYTQQVATEDRYVLRKSELLDRLDAYLGGRVAEEIAFDDVSTGAENDLQQATALARQMVVRCGMSTKLGLANFACDDVGSPWLRAGGRTERCSEATARIIDEEVHLLLDEAHQRVMQTLREKRVLLDRIAALLLEREVLDHAALVSLIECGDASQVDGMNNEEDDSRPAPALLRIH